MSREQAAMVRARTAFSGFLRSGIQRRRALLISAAGALALVIVGIAPVTRGPLRAVASRTAVSVPDGGALSGSSAEMIGRRAPVEATPQPAGDEDGRFRTLRLINSAGRIAPFGGRGR